MIDFTLTLTWFVLACILTQTLILCFLFFLQHGFVIMHFTNCPSVLLELCISLSVMAYVPPSLFSTPPILTLLCYLPHLSSLVTAPALLLPFDERHLSLHCSSQINIYYPRRDSILLLLKDISLTFNEKWKNVNIKWLCQYCHLTLTTED